MSKYPNKKTVNIKDWHWMEVNSDGLKIITSTYEYNLKIKELYQISNIARQLKIILRTKRDELNDTIASFMRGIDD